MSERRQDYPLCPYCGGKLLGFCPPDGDVKKATLYCSSGQCRGQALHGDMNGYDIAFTDLKVIYDNSSPLPASRLRRFVFRLVGKP